MLQRHITEEILDFEQYENIAPAEFHTWTGLTQDQFTELLDSLPSLRTKKNKRTLLAAVLVKLRTGDSNARLANIFKCSETAFHTWLKIGRNALLEDFVPLNVGFDHISRDEVNGPYAATTSDADIMNDMLNNADSAFHWFYRSGDVFILDRGFRDSARNLESCGYVQHMPQTKYPNETQLTTDQANKSRLVTICRWVVEVVNGRFKRDFRLLRNVYNNRALPSMFDYFKIAAAMINRFHVLIEDNPNAAAILEIIHQRINMQNRLADLVIRHNYNRRRAQFTLMTADMPEFVDFPRMDENELLLFALGVYQLKQAKSYYGEHVLDNGAFTIELSNELSNEDLAELQGNDLWMIRGRLQSRHVRARQYYVYIIIDRLLSGRQAIAHYYCSCIIGKRTIGCCSHIMCIIWYMSHARHLPAITPPAYGLENIIVVPNDDDFIVFN
ncbi:unnamed protein product [Parnassius mnemosyne]|uniref:SWIM-type domain-containing protein n=1 Tax=Parnassius mnemosyne TaxID=213953 RepID=A0AAV1L518_9NEOP